MYLCLFTDTCHIINTSRPPSAIFSLSLICFHTPSSCPQSPSLILLLLSSQQLDPTLPSSQSHASPLGPPLHFPLSSPLTWLAFSVSHQCDLPPSPTSHPPYLSLPPPSSPPPSHYPHVASECKTTQWTAAWLYSFKTEYTRPSAGQTQTLCWRNIARVGHSSYPLCIPPFAVGGNHAHY